MATDLEATLTNGEVSPRCSEVCRKPAYPASHASSLRGKAGFFAIPLLTLLALALRAARLGFQPLWWDEGYSVWFATQPLPQMVALTAQDIHPPLYYAVLRGWTLLLGTGPIVLRLFSVWVGVLAVPLIYLAGRRLLSRRIALLAALLLAISPLGIYYSQEVRMYGLMALFSIGILASAWPALRPGGSVGGDGAPLLEPGGYASSGQARRTQRAALSWLALYVMLTTAALYTQYYAALLPIGLTAYALWRWQASAASGTRDTQGLFRWLAAQAVVALLYAPWVLYAGPKLVPYVSQKVQQDADRPLGLLAYLGRHLSAFLAGHLEGPLKPYIHSVVSCWPLALLLFVPVGAGLSLLIRSRHSGPAASRAHGSAKPGPPPAHDAPSAALLMLAVVAATALALGWAISLRYPFFPERGERLLLLVLPPFLLLCAAGVDVLLGRLRAAGYMALGLFGLVSLVSLSAFYLVPRYPGDDYRQLIARTVEQGLPGDTVFAVYPWQVGYWRSYGDPAGPAAVLAPDPSWGTADVGALHAALLRGRVWFPAHLALGAILENRAEAYLGSKAVPFLDEWFGPHTRLSAWENLPPGQPLDFAPVTFSLPGGSQESVELKAVTGSTQPVPAANAVTPLGLEWHASAQPPVLGVSVRLVDELGQIWAQHDYEPLGGPAVADRSENSECDVCTRKHGRTAPASAGWSRTDALGLLVPAGTPPGRYTVAVVVHLAADGRALDAVATDGAHIGTSVPLYPLEISPADRVLGLERLPIAHRQAENMQDGLRFLGYSAGEGVAVPGELRKLSLFWQALAHPSADYTAFVQLLDRDGKVAAGWEAPPGEGYVTGLWMPGTLIRTQAAIRVPAGLPDGRYRLIAGLFRPGDGTRLLTQPGADHIDLGSMQVHGRFHQMQPHQPREPADVRIGAVARLTGYDLGGAAEIRPGDTVPLTLYWQALAPADRPYIVFVHLLDQTGTIRGYGDSEPGGGQFPTPGWLPGEYLADAHPLVIAAGAPPGSYRIAIGLYDPATGERLTASHGGDEYVLGTHVEISSPR